MSNDIIIIGAGPAGLWAAKELADKGQNVTVIEKEKLWISCFGLARCSLFLMMIMRAKVYRSVTGN